MSVNLYKDFSVFMTTKDRLQELKYTLSTLQPYLDQGLNLLICDDGSTDGTYEFLKMNFPFIGIYKNTQNLGLIHSRNKLLAEIKTKYAISLDDDLNFLTENPFPIIHQYFEKEKLCAVISFRIFWSKNEPSSRFSIEQPHRVRNYAGGAHAIRMAAWNEIPDYPDWFVFYGEEEFASLHFLKKGWEIHYLPSILSHHRVNNKERKRDKDYNQRLRRSLRSGWFLYFLFLPWKVVPKKISYSIWMQLKSRISSGNYRALVSLPLALKDLILYFPKLIRYRSALNNSQYLEYTKLPPVKLYWKPQDEKGK